MADGADDVALGDLGFQDISRGQHGPAARQLKGLCRGVPMIEVHLIRRERAPAVSARLRSEVAEKREGRLLASRDPSDLAFLVDPVVAPVGVTLITNRHVAMIGPGAYCVLSQISGSERSPMAQR
jgi:hypothetical protein